MAPDTSPRPKPRPGEGLDLTDFLADFLADLGLPSLFDRAQTWLTSMGNFPLWMGAIIACALGLLVFVKVARRLRARRQRPCRWKKAARQTGGSLTEWRCRTCAAQAYSHDGKPPKDCKKALRVAPL